MITGTGTSPPPGPPALSMTPTTGLNFGSVGVTRNSLPQSLTVTNTGGRATGGVDRAACGQRRFQVQLHDHMRGGACPELDMPGCRDLQADGRGR